MNTIKYILAISLTSLLLTACGGPTKLYIGKKGKKSKARSYVHSTRTKKATKRSTRRPVVTKTKVTTRTAAIDHKRSTIVSTAKKYLGVPYKYGGKNPKRGLDCSGFTSQVYNEVGLNVYGSSKTQSKLGTRKKLTQVAEGDLIVFGNNNRVSHVGIVAEVSGRGVKVIHSTSSRGVVIDNITDSDYWQKKYMYARDIVGN